MFIQGVPKKCPIATFSLNLFQRSDYTFSHVFRYVSLWDIFFGTPCKLKSVALEACLRVNHLLHNKWWKLFVECWKQHCNALMKLLIVDWIVKERSGILETFLACIHRQWWKSYKYFQLQSATNISHNISKNCKL